MVDPFLLEMESPGVQRGHVQNAIHGIFHLFRLLTDIFEETSLFRSQPLRIAQEGCFSEFLKELMIALFCPSRRLINSPPR